MNMKEFQVNLMLNVFGGVIGGIIVALVLMTQYDIKRRIGVGIIIAVLLYFAALGWYKVILIHTPRKDIKK